MLEKCQSMNVLIKEEIEYFENIKEEIEDEEFLSVQQNNQDNWSDTDNCQYGEKLLPFEFIKLEPIEEEYQYVKKEYEEVLGLDEQKFYSYVEQNSEEDRISRKEKRKETTTQRKRRLEKARKKYQEKRINETEEERCQRLQKERLRYEKKKERIRQLRANETAENRRIRLEKKRANYKRRMALETPEERASRRDVNRLRTMRLRAKETPYQRARRKELDRNKHSLQRAQETLEQYEARLEKDRLRHRKLREQDTVKKHGKNKSLDLENASPGKVLVPFQYKQVEPTEQNHNFFIQDRLETERCARGQVIIGTKDEILQRSPRFYSLLSPGRLPAAGTNSRSYRCSSDPTVVIQKLDDRASQPISESFKISLWDTAQILIRREQDRKRKALRRARETEEERNMRRQKERLARAARRARESLEKKLMRRERDRKAKALARAMGLKGKQRKRLSRSKLGRNETFIG